MTFGPFMDNIGTSSFRRVRTVAVNQSPFNGKAYRSGMADSRWQFRFDYQTMTRSQAQPLLAAIATQAEGMNSFQVFDPDFGIPMSGNAADGAVTLTGIRPSLLTTTGWTPGIEVARPGDRVGVQIGGAWQMFTALNFAIASGGGTAAIDLDAPMRGLPSSGATVFLDWVNHLSRGITARLVSYDATSQPGGLFQISVQGEEIL